MGIENIDFTAVVSDIFDAKGKRIPREVGRGVYRDDTNELMAICGPGFKPVQHMDIVRPVLEGLREQGYEIEVKVGADKRSLYDFRGKKGAWISPKVSDGGAIMRTDIILGDFIEVPGQFNDHGLVNRRAGGEDLNFFRISLLNSHNGTYAVRANTSYLRLVCFNGITQPHFSAGAYGKHTVNFNVEGLQKQISNAMGMMGADAERFAVMAKTYLSAEQAIEMLKATIAKLPNKPTGEAHYSEPLVSKIMERFAREDATVWGLYNAVTAWQTHEKFKANANGITALVGRETKVAEMLRSKEWNETFAL
jgi:hypothetical protein